MIEIRSAKSRGHAEHGWLSSHHSFSFANYYDPKHMGFGPLRVINDDRIAGGQGFGEHGHADMEILTYVLSGKLSHKDSLGNGSTLEYGDVQRMSAGRGVRHSEFNASLADPVHLLQIWVMPNAQGIPASYEEASFSPQEKAGQFRLVASSDGRDGSVRIQQDASVFACIVRPGDALALPLGAGRLAYAHVATGHALINGVSLAAGDALKLAEEDEVRIDGGQGEVLVFDLPR